MISRREWLAWSLAGGAGIALGFGGSGCASPPRGNPALFAATFEPSPTGALVAIYSADAAELEVVVEDEITGEIAAVVAATATIERGHTGVAVVEGLRPGRGYRYRVESSAGAVADGYRFRTAPDPEVEQSFSFVVGADIDLAFATELLDELAAADADFLLSLGDVPYADDPPGAQTLDEYRARHAELRGSDWMRAQHEARAWFAIWDDHELRNNWDAHFREVEAARIEAGVRAWDEWFPLRDASRRHRSFRWGALVEIFVLDGRSHRSANADPDGPDKTMLGAEQKSWLLEGLAASAAPFKIVATSVPLDFGWPEDSWQAFATERDEILGTIVGERIPGVVFVTADQHWFAAHRFASGLKELQFGPLSRDTIEPPPQQPEEIARVVDLNYGEVRVLGGTRPRLELRARDRSGAELHVEILEPGIGAIEVASEQPRSFRIHGAHSFAGTAPARFDYASPGRYRLEWDDGGEVVRGVLEDGGVLRF